MLQSIASSNLRAVGYDEGTRILTVQFRNGGTYDYFNVPAIVYSQLLACQPHPWTRMRRIVTSYPSRKRLRQAG